MKKLSLLVESQSRYVNFWLASDGNWYVDIADNADEDDGSDYGSRRDSTTYGAFNSQDDALRFLDSEWPNPGSWNEDESGRRAPPTKSPNGSPVKIVRRPVQSQAPVAKSPPAALKTPQAPIGPTVVPDVVPKPQALVGKKRKIYHRTSDGKPVVNKSALHVRHSGIAYGPDQVSKFHNDGEADVSPSPDSKSASVKKLDSDYTQMWSRKEAVRDTDLNAILSEKTMKKIIKLDQRALRSLIKEAIQTREPGSPLWSPPVMDEAEAGPKLESADAIVSEVGQALGDYFRSQYNAGDPVQSEYGQEAWNVQVDIAVDEIVSSLIEKIEEIGTNLHNGEYMDK